MEGSGAADRKASVLILIRRNLGLKVISKYADEMGRRISVVISTEHSSMRLTNLYALNSPTKNVLQDRTAWFTGDLHEHHIVGGDFNTTMDD